MQSFEEILESIFVKSLIKEPKSIILPYFKTDGPIINEENKSYVVEALMMDYLKKKLEIQKVFKDYEQNSMKTDLEVLEQFEQDVENRIGKQINVMHFYVYDPLQDINQLKKIMSEPNFESWAIT